MRSYLVGIIGLFLLAVTVGQLQASVHVNATFTADNVTAAFYKDGTDPEEITFAGGDDWWNSKSASFDLAPGHKYQIIFRVSNKAELPDYPLGTVQNPAGFLAVLQLSGNLGALPTSIKSTGGSSWKWALDEGGDDLPDFTSIPWTNATAWGYKDGNNNPLNATYGSDNVWGSKSGLSSFAGTGAQWIWADVNGEGLSGDNASKNSLWIMTEINVVPEPATILVWSLLGVTWMGGLTIVRRRRYAWTPEARKAIVDLIESGRKSN